MENATLRGIGILKNSKGPFPSLPSIVVSRATAPFHLTLPLYLPLTTEIDAGNAISSGSSAFILWCTFPYVLTISPGANLRICINTIGDGFEKKFFGVAQRSHLAEVHSHYLRAIRSCDFNSRLSEMGMI